ncbi:hypothetical protein ABGB19_16455 [Mycobacterium sp. B14F4]|uniref:hypothetical protein n=1 Tax=Mycobacterium sp. B14F4 TaxID=3153565 RepID=UPI00325CF61E
MRAFIVTLACVGVTGWSAPVAAAESVVLPERPGPPGVVFTDNPAIVDPHPLAADSFSRAADDRTIAINFITGTPACYGVHAAVQETAQTVTVELRGGTVPEAVGEACIMIAVAGTLDVALQSALGARQVVSAY